MKVEIIVEDNRHYAPSVKNGSQFTSVGYSGRMYGGASPCDNIDEIQRAIKYAKETIISNNDVPVIVDRREKNNLLRWF